MGVKVSEISNEPGRFLFTCPACGCCHFFQVSPAGPPTWTWNANPASPTVQPSILVRGGGVGGRETEGVCHSFIVDGRIQYCGDCTHELAGQTVDLPDFDD